MTTRSTEHATVDADADTVPTAPARPGIPDELLRRALAIRGLLDDTGPDDHATRIRLVAALDVVRLQAAQQWHARGWRPITDAEVVPRPTRSFLSGPALAGIAAALLGGLVLGIAAWVATMLGAVCVAPWVAERLGRPAASVRRTTRACAAVLCGYVVMGTTIGSVVLLPPALLLATIGLVGTGHGPVRSPVDRDD